jgi:hypothetical protein
MENANACVHHIRHIIPIIYVQCSYERDWNEGDSAVDIKIVFTIGYGLLNFLLVITLPTVEDLEIKEPQLGFSHTSQRQKKCGILHSQGCYISGMRSIFYSGREEC